MSAPRGRTALAVASPEPPAGGPGAGAGQGAEAPAPAWLRQLVDGLVAGGQATAAAALIGNRRGVVTAVSAGDARPGRGRSQPLFDLASLSKLWTASLALRLAARGALPLATSVGDLWPGCDPRLAGRTLEDLLRHRAGLRPWTALYRRCRRRASVARLLTGGELLGARRGTYSDLDYVLWGLSAERALGRPLGDLLRDELARPLGLDHRPPPRAGAFWLPCRLGNGREVELAAAQGLRVAPLGPPAAGRVQDGNARFLGAPAGHAGVFATPRAMLALAREWLRPQTLWPAAAARAALAGPGPYALGWRRATRRGSAGPALGPGAFGHVGFTGGSVWLDPASGAALVLLAHRASLDVQLAPARRRFHALALAARRGR